MAAPQGPSRSLQIEVARIVELLADYISATEEPRAVLMTAVAQLQHEVQTTHQVAASHLRGRQVARM
jgi:hypothetical protein